MAEYTKSFEIYDALYLSIKDYEEEARRIHGIIVANKKSQGNDLLDVACGTGLHAQALKDWFCVEGLDLSEGQLSIAQKRLPGLRLYKEDMTKFDTGKQYDAITCLFSAIGELLTLEEVQMAIANMSRHLKPGGVLIVEPWLLTGQFVDDHSIWADFVDTPELKIARMTGAELSGNIVTLTMHHMIGRLGCVEEFVEVHKEAMYSSEEYLDAFNRAGLDSFFDPSGLGELGLFIGTKPVE